MADLTYAQIKRVWLDAAKGTKYATNAWASLMAAIAEAESSGDPNATNPNDNGGTQTSWGLWQISNGSHSPVSSQWASPVVNAQLAIQKLDTASGLGNWGTYDSGAYKAYLNDSTTPAATVPSTGGAAGQAAAQLTAAETASAAQAPALCGLGFDQHVGVFFGHGPTVTFCVLSKTQIRAMMGGIFIVVGGAAALAGLAVLLATTTGVDVRALTKLAGQTKNAVGQVRGARQQRGAPGEYRKPYGPGYGPEDEAAAKAES
jgi:hypothetical protein